MNLKIEKKDESTHITIDGDLNIYTVRDAYNSLSEERDIFAQELVLDLALVGDLDTAGVQLILYLRKKIANTNAFRIIHATGTASATLSLLGLQGLSSPEVA
jgi:anti-sigma B factor antagonist